MLLKVNPTRIELIKLKRKLKIAEHGWRLLKKKRDSLMKEFLEVIKKIKILREKIENDFSSALKDFVFAKASLREKEIQEIFTTPSQKIYLKEKKETILGIETPQFSLVKEGDFLNYSLISTSVNLDLGLLKIENLIEDLVKLGELQKRALSLAQELEKTRRRVNALEFIYIPRLKATIKYIFNKLEERERFEKIILMKSKEKIASLG